LAAVISHELQVRKRKRSLCLSCRSDKPPTEAQKKENIDIRTKQIDRGLQAAIDQGLGEWAVKRAGRDFVRVEPYNLDTLSNWAELITH
jgi:hypothetical protein